jgi:hypothetical protein
MAVGGPLAGSVSPDAAYTLAVGRTLTTTPAAPSAHIVALCPAGSTTVITSWSARPEVHLPV